MVQSLVYKPQELYDVIGVKAEALPQSEALGVSLQLFIPCETGRRLEGEVVCHSCACPCMMHHGTPGTWLPGIRRLLISLAYDKFNA